MEIGFVDTSDHCLNFCTDTAVRPSLIPSDGSEERHTAATNVITEQGPINLKEIEDSQGSPLRLVPQ